MRFAFGSYLRGSTQCTAPSHPPIVSIGTFAITLLHQDSPELSPFNVTESFSATSLTKAQVQELFQEFANDRGITQECIQCVCEL